MCIEGEWWRTGMQSEFEGGGGPLKKMENWKLERLTLVSMLAKLASKK
jgi:hypothetical protein